ncbi:hypothetical protein [Actinosynnema sp. NPDC023587]|uniref:hypothetical protein n=1 Tax=Actinosynnema sp. NPDC023587 TaxID=3154695 RepID=UPI0034080BD8
MTQVDERPPTGPADENPNGRGLVASRASLLAAGSSTAATATTVGLQFGPTGLVVAGAVAAGTAVGAAAVRRFAPRTAERLGLRRPTGTPSRSAATGGRAGRRSGAAGGGARRGGGLLGANRRIAGGAPRRGAGAKPAGRRGLVGGRQGAGSKRGVLGRGGRPNGKSSTRPNGRGLLGKGRPGKGRPGAGTGRRSGAGRPTGTAKRPGGSTNGKKSPFGRGRNTGTKRGNGPSPTGKTGRGGNRPKGLLKRSAKRRKDNGSGWEEYRVNGKKARIRWDGVEFGDMADETTGTTTTGSTGEPAPATAGTSSEGTTMPNPFDNHNEALATATSNLDIENARALIDWVDNAPGAAETQAAMWNGHAHKIQEQILVAGEFAEALHDFAATQARQAERIREVGVTFRRAHSEELRRINEPKPGEDKWDISKNRA